MRRHPFTVAGRIERCWLFVYRTPVEAVRPLLPATLAPVTHGGFAFWNIVVCRLGELRPTPVPAFLGLGYWHAAYRLHVRAEPERGKPLEGLHFVRSDCDRSLVVHAGNLLTDFHFHLAGIQANAIGGLIISPDAGASFTFAPGRPELAPGSPFSTLEEAAAFLEYRPASLSPHGPDSLNVVRVIRDEAAWHSRLLTVSSSEWQFFAGRDVALEVCYEIAPIEYRWARGEIIRVKPCAS